MSEKLKAKIGEDLYKQVLAKGLKAADVDIVSDGGWIPKARFNEVNDKYKETSSKIDTYQKQLEDTKKLLEGSEDFKTKYASLESKYNDDLKAKDTQIANISKRYAVESALLKEGAKHTDLLLKDIDFTGLAFDKENNVLGIDTEMKRLKEERSDFFPKQKSSSTSTKLSEEDKNPLGGAGDDGEEDWEEKLKHIG